MFWLFSDPAGTICNSIGIFEDSIAMPGAVQHSVWGSLPFTVPQNMSPIKHNTGSEWFNRFHRVVVVLEDCDQGPLFWTIWNVFTHYFHANFIYYVLFLFQLVCRCLVRFRDLKDLVRFKKRVRKLSNETRCLKGWFISCAYVSGLLPCFESPSCGITIKWSVGVSDGPGATLVIVCQE